MNNDIDFEELKTRTVVGLTENVIIKNDSHENTLLARIDTGATKSSLDLTLASEMRLGPVIDSRLIKSAHGAKLRPVVEVFVTLHGKTIKERFTLADRSHMKYPVLIGQNILRKGFLVDPSRSADKTASKSKK